MVLRTIFIAAILAARCLALPAQESEQKPPRLQVLVERAEKLAKTPDMTNARLQNKEALQMFQAMPAERRNEPKMQSLAWRIGTTAHVSGDLISARDAWLQCLEHRSTLPEDNFYLDIVRHNLAIVFYALGDTHKAKDFQEKVLSVRRKKLPNDHSKLQSARNNMALTMRRLGNVSGALDLQEKVLAVYLEKLPGDHRLLQQARGNIAVTRQKLGDFVSSRKLQEQVLESCLKTLPDEDPYLQTIRTQLAYTMAYLGDPWAALAMQEKALAVYSRTLPEEHPTLLGARCGLAVIKHCLGDLSSAREIQEHVLAIYSSLLPKDNLGLQYLRGNLALTKHKLGDFAGAQALSEKLLAFYSEHRPEESLDLQLARHNLADLLRVNGDLVRARDLQDKVLAVCSRTLPKEASFYQLARASLASTKHALGDVAGARELALHRCQTALSKATLLLGSPRGAALTATVELDGIGGLLSLPPSRTAQARIKTASTGLLTSQGLRRMELGAFRRLARARHRSPQRAATLETRLQETVLAVLSASNRLQQDQSQTARRTNLQALAETIRKRDLVARELAQLGGIADIAIPDIARLAAKLPQGAAAVAIISYVHRTPYGKPGRWRAEERLVGFVLGPSGILSQHALGLRATVDEQVKAMRLAGVANSEVPTKALRQLGAQVFGPLVAALPRGTKTIILSVDDSLEVAPLDSVILPSKSILGGNYRLERVTSLLDLLEDPGPKFSGIPDLVSFGGVDFANPPSEDAPVIDDASNPGVPGGQAYSWGPLNHTKAEVQSLARDFAEVFGKRHAKAFFASDASKSTLSEHAPSATFLHVATHGFFAPETAKSLNDKQPIDQFNFARAKRISGFSPYVLTGLALAGGNLPADERGRRIGIITAEEVAHLDLSNCYLATLSACETSLGVRRAGQSFASLRGAFHAAGARYVLTTLWKVGDEQSKDLMTNFYRLIWRDKMGPHEALAAARSSIREKGATFRDWGGWVLTGR